MHVPDDTVTIEQQPEHEFEPNSEAHHFGYMVQMVDAGGTLEMQITERNGRVSRLATGEDSTFDRNLFTTLLNEVANRMLDAWGI